MSKVLQLVTQFELLSKNSDFEFGSKNPPAPKEKIEELETLLGVSLPDDMKEFYLIANGWPSIDGRYMDINSIEDIISDLNDSESKRLCLIGASGPNDFFIYMYTPKATGKGLCLIVEDWFEEVQLSEDDAKLLSPSFGEKLLSSASLLDEGKYLSPPFSFTQVLEHLLKYNASTL